jgi:hypothetical protein
MKKKVKAATFILAKLIVIIDTKTKKQNKKRDGIRYIPTSLYAMVQAVNSSE